MSDLIKTVATLRDVRAQLATADAWINSARRVEINIRRAGLSFDYTPDAVCMTTSDAEGRGTISHRCLHCGSPDTSLIAHNNKCASDALGCSELHLMFECVHCHKLTQVALGTTACGITGWTAEPVNGFEVEDEN